MRLSSDIVQNKNAERKARVLLPLLRDRESVLDFGCGDLAMSHKLWTLKMTLKITGIDVIDFGHHYPQIKYKKFNGGDIPFGEKSFDVVIAYHVFHHTQDPDGLLKQCCRIAKRRILVVEPVPRSIVELPGMIVMDWVFNVWKEKQVSMTYNFKTKKWWLDQAEKLGCSVSQIIDVELLPSWSPTGRSLLFVIDKN